MIIFTPFLYSSSYLLPPGQFRFHTLLYIIIVYLIQLYIHFPCVVLILFVLFWFLQMYRTVKNTDKPAASSGKFIIFLMLSASALVIFYLIQFTLINSLISAPNLSSLYFNSCEDSLTTLYDSDPINPSIK